MAEVTKIEWTAFRVALASLPQAVVDRLVKDRGAYVVGKELVIPGYTFNPWIGCTMKSPGCFNCYAAQQDKFRHWTPEGWGKGKPRQRTSAANWKQVERWNKEAAELGIRPRVFCASLADWLDDEVAIEWLADFLDLVRRCQNLDFLLLSKRPENWQSRIEGVIRWIESLPDWSDRGFHTRGPLRDWLADWVLLKRAPANIWIGATVEDVPRVRERIAAVVRIPASVRFLSCEPLLEGITLGLAGIVPENWGFGFHPIAAFIDWVICGGESGPGARRFDVRWARALRDECKNAGVAFFMKQLGAKPYESAAHEGDTGCELHITNRKGGDMADWPADLRIREFPEVAS